MNDLFTALGDVETLRADVPEDAWPTAVGEANTHIHLPPNFSAFDTVEQAVQLAAEQGVQVLGAGNYYDYTVYGPFGRLCRESGIAPLFGLEIVVGEPALAEAGVRVNDPKNPGKTYLCGKGTTAFADPSPQAAATMARIRSGDEQRIRQMIDRINAHAADLLIRLTLDYEVIVDALVGRHGSPRETICLQERHVAQACQEALFAESLPEERPYLFRRLFGEDPSHVVRAVAVQNDVRTYLMKAGRPAFVEESFIDFEDACGLILELGGIPCYPILADGADPVCEFEQSPEALAAELHRRGIHMAEMIPVRNQPDVVARYAKTLRARGIVMTAGTEHNTLDLLPLVPTCVGGIPIQDDLKEIFWEGACVVAAHQFLRAHGQAGFTPGPSDDDIRRLRALGEAVIRRFASSASDTEGRPRS